MIFLKIKQKSKQISSLFLFSSLLKTLSISQRFGSVFGYAWITQPLPPRNNLANKQKSTTHFSLEFFHLEAAVAEAGAATGVGGWTTGATAESDEVVEVSEVVVVVLLLLLFPPVLLFLEETEVPPEADEAVEDAWNGQKIGQSGEKIVKSSQNWLTNSKK